MINYQSPEPVNNWIKLEKCLVDDLSESSFKLLIKLMMLKANENNSNQNLMKITGFGERKFLNAKNELIDKGYLDTRQVYGNKYVMYIGKERVKHYRNSKHKKENRHTLNQIKKVKDTLDTDKM